MFLITFFHETYAGARKNKKRPKKKTLAQCPRLPDRQMTYQTYCVERSHSLFIFYHTMIVVYPLVLPSVLSHH